jgi:hypothetical protein
VLCADDDESFRPTLRVPDEVPAEDDWVPFAFGDDAEPKLVRRTGAAFFSYLE